MLDQFISGLGSLELQKHVQFQHPETLYEAIYYAMEYTSVSEILDQTSQFHEPVTPVTPLQPKVNSEEQLTFTQKQLEELINLSIDMALAAKKESDQQGNNSETNTPTDKVLALRPTASDENQSKRKLSGNSENITMQESSDMRICNSSDSESELLMLRNTHEELKTQQLVTGSNTVSQNLGLDMSTSPQLTNSLNLMTQFDCQINNFGIVSFRRNVFSAKWFSAKCRAPINNGPESLWPGNSLIPVDQDCNVLTHGFACQRSLTDLGAPEQTLVVEYEHSDPQMQTPVLMTREKIMK